MKTLPNSRYHTSSESSYPPDLHKPSRQDEAARGRNKTRDRDRAGIGQTPDYPGQQFNPHLHHPWNNNHSQSTPRNQSPADSNGSNSGNKKGRGRKVKKSESESGISKLLKTLRKDSSGKKAEKLRGKEASTSSSTLDGRFRLQRRGSLDRSPTRKRGSSPDRRRAKSMDRRAERAQRDRTPEREECDDGGFLAVTPERNFYERRVLKDSATPGRMREVGTPERSNNNNSDTLSYTSRGRTLDRPAKNGNLLRDSSSERYRMNGTPERRYRDSSPDSTYSREEPNYAAAAPPRLKDYYSMMKNNATQYNHAAAYNNAGQNNNMGRGSNQLPEPKRRLYKESPKDLSI